MVNQFVCPKFFCFSFKNSRHTKKKNLWGFVFKNQKRDFLGVKINSFWAQISKKICVCSLMSKEASCQFSPKKEYLGPPEFKKFDEHVKIFWNFVRISSRYSTYVANQKNFFKSFLSWYQCSPLKWFILIVSLKSTIDNFDSMECNLSPR